MLTQRKKVFLAGLGSAAVHAVLLLVAAYVIAHGSRTPPPAAPEPFHLEIVKSDPEVAATPVPTPAKHALDTSMMKATEHPPAVAAFQGDTDTVAASELPATGDKPLPTQLGRAAPGYVFDPSPPASPAAQPQSPPVAPEPSPVPGPPKPEPTRAVKRPPVEKSVPILVRNEIALLDTQPSPPPEEQNPYDPSFRSTAPPPPVPVRATPRPSAYRPMEERTASSGNITTRGISSVDAVATPYGRYRKQVFDSIRLVWTDALQAHGDVASLGIVKLHFALDRTGHVHTARILSNSANEALASITLDAVDHTPLPPIPPDVLETMDGAMLQLDITFESL